MTDDEQHDLLGSLVRERNRLRQRIASLKEELSRSKDGMRRAHDAMNLATQGNWSIAEDGFDFLSPDDLSASLMELRKAEDSLAGIEQQLDEA